MSDEAQQPPKSQEPPKAPRTVQLSADPNEYAAQCKDAHLYTVGGMIIGGIADAKGFLKTDNITAASMVAEGFLNELIRSVRPRDALEEMLLVQMAMVHQRIGNLSLQASEQVHTKNVAVINQALDGACNTFRRQMMALAEYRRATRSRPADEWEWGGSQGEEKHANEQGSSAPASSAVPTLGGGIEVPARVGAAPAAVGTQHGSANGNGKVALKTQRAETRPVQHCPTRRTAAVKRVDPATARRRRS